MNTGSGLHCKFFSDIIFSIFPSCVQIWLPHLPHEAQPGEGVRAAVQQLGPLRAQGDCQGQGCWGQGQVRPHAPKSGDFYPWKNTDGFTCSLVQVTVNMLFHENITSKEQMVSWLDKRRPSPESECKVFQTRTIRKTRSSLLKAFKNIFELSNLNQINIH